MARKPVVSAQPYEISARVARQAGVRPYQRDPQAPLYRPIRIFTLADAQWIVMPSAPDGIVPLKRHFIDSRLPGLTSSDAMPVQ